MRSRLAPMVLSAHTCLSPAKDIPFSSPSRTSYRHGRFPAVARATTRQRHTLSPAYERPPVTSVLADIERYAWASGRERDGRSVGELFFSRLTSTPTSCIIVRYSVHRYSEGRVGSFEKTRSASPV